MEAAALLGLVVAVGGVIATAVFGWLEFRKTGGGTRAFASRKRKA